MGGTNDEGTLRGIQRWRDRDHHHHHGLGDEGPARRPSGRLGAAPTDIPELCLEFHLCGHLLEQSSSHAARGYGGDRGNDVGQLVPVVLAVAIPVRHRMDGAEPFHRCAYRALWGGVVDGRDRLPRASAVDHSRPRARFNSQKGSRARLEGKAFISAVCRGDPCSVTCNLDRSRARCAGCTELAGSGPAYRKTPCRLDGKENTTTRLHTITSRMHGFMIRAATA